MIKLKGMTWSHPRGYDPLVASSTLWRAKTGVEVAWDKRSLQDFESFPVEDLAKAYDLIVIDYPHVGHITAQKCLAPLDVPGREVERAALAAASVGASYRSYDWDGHQWALPIDAATQVMAYRADLLPSAPRRWDDVMTLARQGRVAVPMRVPHTLMMALTLSANMERPCGTSRESPFFDPDCGRRVVGMIAGLVAFLDPADFERDPIAVSEILATGDGARAVMPYGYGYVSYAREGFRPHRLTFTDIPVAGGHGPIGSALGGTGLAVSAYSANADAAIDYAYWVASAEVQRGPYAESGGQPGHATAWEDPGVNAGIGNFYRNTRATLEGAYVRPRHDGYIKFQEEGGCRLNAGLRAREAPDTIVAALNRLFEDSFP
ncbi:MAG TPA: extracellular solute-binding protein [Candidatus Binataceae bacterium]|nr:extracellular solute-binding protein [Candidatus Binataceae bacterium]